MATSRTSGRNTEDTKALWGRRAGDPGGGRTESEKIGGPRRGGAQETITDDDAARAAIVSVCDAHGVDVETIAPAGWWRGLASADRATSDRAWWNLEEVLVDLDDAALDAVVVAAFAVVGGGHWRRVKNGGGDPWVTTNAMTR